MFGARAKPSSCLSIKSTSVCSPWSGKDLYIDSSKLQKVYGIKEDGFDAEAWEQILQKSTGGGEVQAAMWDKWVSCPGYKGAALQYLRSYVCLTDIFLYSAKCNEDVTNLTPVCPEVCENYGGAISKMIADENVCPVEFDGMPLSSMKLIMKRRHHVKNAIQSCKQISKLGFFNSKEQCVTGVKLDSESCGFAGLPTIAQKYCKAQPDATCCTSLAPTSKVADKDATYQDDETLMGGIQRIAMMWGGTVSISYSSYKRW